MSIERSIALSLITVLVVCCSPTTAQTSKQLAKDQTLRVPISSEPSVGMTSLDPALLDNTLETAIGHNIFDGLYRYDDQLREQPDIAVGMPVVSADGKTYTFHLRDDVRFSNGTKVTARDFVYSWSRAAAAQGSWAFAFQPVVGYPTALALSTPDPYTLVARLSAPTGYWLAELALPSAWVVDSAAIKAGGDERWWTTPEGLLGTGPYRLTSWTHNVELDFAAVPNWWGGSTGTLKSLELHVVADPAARWKGYLDGNYDLLGFGRPDLGATDVAPIGQLRSDPRRRAEVHTWAHGTTAWVAFNLQSGLVSGYADGKSLRQAFSQAIDRQRLAQAVCQGGTICVPATGGLISKGLLGYLGDGLDPMAKFDPAGALATVNRLDPAVAENLASQWSSNLGVSVTFRGLDKETIFTVMGTGTFTIFRQGWEGDYNHPQDWFDNLLIFNGGSCLQLFCTSFGAIYDRAGYRPLILSADQKPLADALSDYRTAGRMLVDDAALGALYYMVRTAVVKPYVDGYGANALWEYRWSSIRILQH
jgi:oligopeptide transport system substrate-binding protein